MKRRQVWASLLVGVLLVFSLAACGNAGKIDVTKLDKDALLKEVSQKISDAGSMNGTVSLNMDMTVANENGVPIQTSLYLEGTMVAIEKPSQKLKFDMNMAAKASGQTQNVNLQLYLVEENGQMKVYYDSQSPAAVKEGMLESMPFENGQALGPVNNAAQAQATADYLTEPEIVGLETVNGKDAIHLRAKLDLSELLASYQSELESGMSAQDIASLQLMLRMLDIKEDIWADAQTHDPVREEVDLGDSLNSLMQQLLPLMEGEGSDVKFNRLDFKLTMTDFNAAQDFDVPAKLKDPSQSGAQTTTPPGTAQPSATAQTPLQIIPQNIIQS